MVVEQSAMHIIVFPDPSSAGALYIQYPDMAITIPTYILAHNGAGSSSDSVIISKLDIVSLQFLCFSLLSWNIYGTYSNMDDEIQRNITTLPVLRFVTNAVDIP